MQLWWIIPGKDGQFEETMLEHGVMALGWSRVDDMSNIEKYF